MQGMNDIESMSIDEVHKNPDTSRREPHSDGPASTGDTAGISDEERSQDREYGGRKGPDPVRYGDWEKNGRCIDF